MKYLYLYGGAIGDSLVGIHLGRWLAARRPGARLTLLSTRRNPFVRELVQNIPFVRYRELLKEDPRTWWHLGALLLSPSSVFAFEPTDVPVPPWWRLILGTATWLPTSREVRSQVVGHERAVPHGTKVVTVTPEDNLFSVNVPRILAAWGIEPGGAVVPSLPMPAGAVPSERTILFHFFAGSYRRSWPVEKVRPVLERARALFPEHAFVLTATPAERPRALRMIAGIDNARVEDDLSARELVRALAEADLVVGVASGVTHLSSHLGKPTIALANLSDPYWLPTYTAKTVLLANRAECRCKGNKEGECNERTPDGDVFRCLYFIPTDEVITAMQHALPV